MNDVFVLAHSQRSWSTVFLSLSQTTPTGFVDNVCVYTALDTADEGVLYDSVLEPCSADHDVIFSANHHLLCIDIDCKRAVRLPHGPADLQLVEFGGYGPASAGGRAVFDWSFRVLQTSTVSAQQRAAVLAYDAQMLTLMPDNKLQLTRRQLSSIAYVTRNSSDELYVDVSMTGRGEAMET